MKIKKEECVNSLTECIKKLLTVLWPFSIIPTVIPVRTFYQWQLFLRSGGQRRQLLSQHGRGDGLPPSKPSKSTIQHSKMVGSELLNHHARIIMYNYVPL